MTKIILIKNSIVAGDVPVSLTKGELAVNIADKTIFIGDSNGNPVQIGNGTGIGINGISAYQIAVQLGYVGTPQQWIASLHGANGLDGKSAYQSALDIGFVGTSNQWIASLHGKDGANGVNGTTGPTGLSAYELAVYRGYVGTEVQWLASLVGSVGPTGISAYQIAVNNGFVGSQSEWLLSLKGATGSNQDFAFTQKVIIVTTDQIAQKSILLDFAAFDPMNVSLTLSGGIQQFPGIDFIVTNNVLSWDQLSLELLIEVGQYIMITYKPITN